MNFIVQMVIKQLKVDLNDICEKKISNTLRGFIIRSIKEILCESDELKPILDECFTYKANAIIQSEMQKISFPLTVKQLSVLTGLTPDAIYQRRHRGQLHFEKKDGRIYISIRELYSQLLDPSVSKVTDD